ncbi:MAG: chemotaxis protein CheC [Fimbriimonadales bacterium]|nr:chemotaxis protein CheC [Fimbriimonadales bacterium]MDW8052613.1 chemotaxis protein CheC [Armatimonadota bacterium]
MHALLNELRADALREIGNIGLGGAVTALSDLTGVLFALEAPQVVPVDTRQVPQLVGVEPESLVVGTISRITGDWPGEGAFLFPWESACVLWQVLVQMQPNGLEDLNELYQSVINEVSNIMLGNYLRAISQMTGFHLNMEPPAFAADMAAAVLSAIVVEAMYGQRELLAIETRFKTPAHAFSGYFFYLPETGSLERLFQVLGI